MSDDPFDLIKTWRKPVPDRLANGCLNAFYILMIIFAVMGLIATILRQS